MISLSAMYDILDTDQIKKLNSLMAIHGNIVAICEHTGLNRATIKRAAEGKRVKLENLEAIVNFLENF
jgi:DNA-binding Xre family transcriptional regulator